jgi:hypothetical protein
MGLILGFTGTRHHPTNEQVLWLHTQAKRADIIHHGGCTGADATIHTIALAFEIPVVVHPPTNTKHSDPRLIPGIAKSTGLVTILEPREYHHRDIDIVNECETLAATPDGPQRHGSGTWFTVEYARQISRPGLICYPDGTVEDLLLTTQG